MNGDISEYFQIIKTCEGLKKKVKLEIRALNRVESFELIDNFMQTNVPTSKQLPE